MSYIFRHSMLKLLTVLENKQINSHVFILFAVFLVRLIYVCILCDIYRPEFILLYEIVHSYKAGVGLQVKWYHTRIFVVIISNIIRSRRRYYQVSQTALSRSVNIQYRKNLIHPVVHMYKVVGTHSSDKYLSFSFRIHFRIRVSSEPGSRTV